jgi:hypothetical protein
MKPVSIGAALRRFSVAYIPVYLMGMGFIMPRGDLSIAQILELLGLAGFVVGASMSLIKPLRAWAFTLGAALAFVFQAALLFWVWV